MKFTPEPYFSLIRIYIKFGVDTSMGRWIFIRVYKCSVWDYTEYPI